MSLFFKSMVVLGLLLNFMACGSRHKVEDEPVADSGGSNGGLNRNRYDENSNDLQSLYISYDPSSDLIAIRMHKYSWEYNFDFMVDFKNNIFISKKQGQIFAEVRFECLKPAGNSCDEFQLRGLPFLSKVMKFTKEKLSIVEIETGAVIYKTVFKVESGVLKNHMNVDKFFYIANDGVGEFYLGSWSDTRLSDATESLQYSSTYIWLSLPKQLAFYDYSCMATVEPTKEVKHECEFIDKFDATVIKKSWLVSITP